MLKPCLVDGQACPWAFLALLFKDTGGGHYCSLYRYTVPIGYSMQDSTGVCCCALLGSVIHGERYEWLLTRTSSSWDCMSAVPRESEEPLLIGSATGLPLFPSSRLLVMAVLFLARVVDYLCSAALSVALDGPHGLAHRNGWGDNERGLILSAFFWGYVPAQLPAGWLAVRWGPRRLLIACTAVQAILAAVFVPCARSGVVSAVAAARAALGVAQAGLSPCMVQLIAVWLPVDEASFGFALADCGASVGAALALATSPPLLALGGWPCVFWVGSATSVVVVFILLLCVWDSPRQHPRMAPGERAFLADVIQRGSDHGNNRESPGRVPWRELFTAPSVLILAPVSFAAQYSWYTFLAFLPQYAHDQLHFSMAALGLYATLPYLACTLGILCFGCAADALVRTSAHRLEPTRKACHLLASVVPAALLFSATHVHSAMPTLGLLSSANFFYGAAWSGAFIAPVHVSPPYAGLVQGYTNGVGNLAGVVAP